MNYEWINKVDKQGKVDERIPVDPGTKSKSKTKPRYESRKIATFKTRIRLNVRLKNSRNILW